MKKQSLGDRMKGYEDVSRIYLTRRMPLILRIDGKAFHSFTKRFYKPFDAVLMHTMQRTMVKLCEAIQGCKLGYTQSDEISLLLVDYDKLDTTAWFDKNLQKVVSLSASIATMEFNREFVNTLTNNDFIDKADIDVYNRVAGTAMFDSRAFVLPESEVCNYFLWRQQDATRNAIVENVARFNAFADELSIAFARILDERYTDDGEFEYAIVRYGEQLWEAFNELERKLLVGLR